MHKPNWKQGNFIRINYLDGVVLTSEGCGCCSDDEPITNSNIDEIIDMVSKQLDYLFKLKEMNDDKPRP